MVWGRSNKKIVLAQFLTLMALGQLPQEQLPLGQLSLGQLPHRKITPSGHLPQDNYPFRTTTLIGWTITPEDNQPHFRNLILYS